MNRVNLAGYLGSDPEARVTSNGNPQSRISIGVNDLRSWDTSYFIPCTAWQQTATYINNNLHKGDFVIVDGRLTRHSYVNKDGKTIYVMEVVIDSLKNYGSRKPANKPAAKTQMVSLDESLTDNVDVNFKDAFKTSTRPQVETKKETTSSSIDWEDDLD